MNLTSQESVPKWVYESEQYKFKQIERVGGQKGNRLEKLQTEYGCVWTLDTTSLSPMEEAYIKKIAKLRKSVVGDITYGFCGKIASNVVTSLPEASGRIHGLGKNKTNKHLEFIGHGNHYVALAKLTDGSFVSIDYALSNNIDPSLLEKDQETFDTLLIRAKSENELLAALEDLYEAVWQKSK